MERALFICLLCVVLAADAAPRARESRPGGLTSSGQQQVAELLQLQAKSADGVVELDTSSFDRLVVGKKRPYSLVIFLAADHLQDKPALKLRELREEFGHLAKAFRKNHANTTATGKLFFALVEYRRSGQLFHRLGVTSLPYIFRLAPSFQIEADGTLKLRADDSMKQSDYSAYPWSAEDMASFVLEKTGVTIGSIEKPSIFKSRLFPFLALAATAGLAWVAYQLYYAEFMKNTALWTFGTVAVFWFSVSGGMHNIIRGVPMYYVEPSGGRVQLFLPQGQGQLGAEGFIMGSLVTTFALSLATLSYLAPRVADPAHRRIVSYMALLLGSAAFYQILRGYRMKTGYRWRTWF